MLEREYTELVDKIWYRKSESHSNGLGLWIYLLAQG